jgi:Mn-dependent DtxR family transcriptional regulator
VADVQISARDLTLAALYVAGEVVYRRRLHCVVYWIVEELESVLRNPFCGCKPTWRLGPTGIALYRYGPYSFDVADALEELKAEGLVEEEPAAAYAPCLGAAVKVYKLRLTERGREVARQMAASLPEELTREIERLLRISLCDFCGPIMKKFKDLDLSPPDDELIPVDSP